jgi:histidinol-phosphatase (PHP family)
LPKSIHKKRCDSLFPSPWIIKEMKKMNIPIIISSDAHQPVELQMLFAEAVEAARQVGYTETMIFGKNGWNGSKL